MQQTRPSAVILGFIRDTQPFHISQKMLKPQKLNLQLEQATLQLPQRLPSHRVDTE